MWVREKKLTLLELELLYTGLIGSDGSALNTDGVLLDGLSGINSDLVVGLITVLETQVVVLEVDVEEGVDELLLDVLPDDAGHLIAIELDDGVLDLNLLESLGSHCAVSVVVGDEEGRGSRAREGRSSGDVTRVDRSLTEGGADKVCGDGRHGGKREGGGGLVKGGLKRGRSLGGPELFAPGRAAGNSGVRRVRRQRQEEAEWTEGRGGRKRSPAGPKSRRMAELGIPLESRGC